MGKIIIFITNCLIEEGLIEKEEENIYVFGLDLFFKYLFNIIFILIVGVINNCLIEVVVFVLFFTPVRSYAGGIHFKKESICLLFTLVIIQCVIFILKFNRFDNVVYYFASILMFFLIMRIGPVDNKNKALENIEFIFFKKKLFKIISVELLILTIAFFLHINYLVILISLSFLFNAISMYSGNYFRYRENNIIL